MIRRVLTRSMKLKMSSEMNPGERVSWTGQPLMLKFAKRGIALSIFGIPWTAFAIFWVYAAAGFEMPAFTNGFDFFPLFGIPFILIGLGLITAPVWWALSARDTVYELTDQRAIIFSRKSKLFTITDYLPAQLKDVYREEDAKGRGSVVFFDQEQSPSGSRSSQIGFLGIRQVRDVEILVKKLARTA